MGGATQGVRALRRLHQDHCSFTFSCSIQLALMQAFRHSSNVVEQVDTVHPTTVLLPKWPRCIL